MPIVTTPPPVAQQRIALRGLAYGAVLAAGATLGAVGCYSGDDLVERVRNRAIRTRLEEVELGSFRVTLPRDEESGEMTEIDIRLFGQTERYKVNEVEAQLEERGPLIEDQLLTALRESTREQLVEPDLASLKQMILTTTNDLLEDSPLKAVGFYDLRFIRH